jgi:glycogen operon protein
LAGDLLGEVDERGEDIVGDTILLLLNAHYEAIPFTLPATQEGELWERLLDTVDPQGIPLTCTSGQQYTLQGRAMTVLRIKAQQEEAP